MAVGNAAGEIVGKLLSAHPVTRESIEADIARMNRECERRRRRAQARARAPLWQKKLRSAVRRVLHCIWLAIIVCGIAAYFAFLFCVIASI